MGLCKFIFERNFETEGPLKAYFQQHNWHRHFHIGFAEHHDGDLVREFYTYIELDPYRRQVAKVKGKDVDFSPSAINRVLKLQDIPRDEYTAYLENERNDGALLSRTLMGEEKRLPDGWTYLAKEELTPLANFIHHLIGCRIMPFRMNSQVQKKRAWLTCAILLRKSVDVGKIIHDEINGMVGSEVRKTQALGFPALITSLCHRAGVASLVPPSSHLVASGRHHTDVKGTLKLKEFTKGSEPRRAGPADEEEDDEEEGEDPIPREQPQEQPRPRTMLQRIDALQTEQAAIRQELTEHHRRVMEELQFMADANEVGLREMRREMRQFQRYPIQMHTFQLSGSQGPPPLFDVPPDTSPLSP
ncbi:hypothetical protein BPMI_04503c [Candidatus Burkholderia pumila]|uniref:Putative plant transposon protein domain-containing protein n=1 Tax=Candidatus Burkholderia pumila TaxID=1090375 RepID=A0ABR5HJW4_9BURK|nr:hypothetical protein BPMI_04503c [Candidatus Burkholderia pumila]